MKRHGKPMQWIVAMAIGFVAALTLTAVVGRDGMSVAAPAQAQSLTSRTVMTLSTDGFFVTTNSSGNEVFLWYFSRDGRRVDSKLYFVHKADQSSPKPQNF